MKYPKYFIGPMSKNIVDCIIEFTNERNIKIGLIPSRRQVDYNGGYVNNWNTEEFSKYVNSKTSNVLLMRDHAGPGQGPIEDDGFESLKHDCKYLDVIHIDPWKKYSTFSDGLEWTIKMIEYCYSLNPLIVYEVGTEEAIRKFESYELSDLMHQLKYRLPSEMYNQIHFLVIQSGTSLKGNTQTGNYDKSRLVDMLNVCIHSNIISKEHNGDYIDISVIKEKMQLGLHSINIAPEFGLIETQTYLDEIQDDETFEKYFQICHNSKKWVKWVNTGFDPVNNKKELIRICGHYVLSDPKFLQEIKSKFTDIDLKIKNNITAKLIELHGFHY